MKQIEYLEMRCIKKSHVMNGKWPIFVSLTIRKSYISFFAIFIFCFPGSHIDYRHCFLLRSLKEEDSRKNFLMRFLHEISKISWDFRMRFWKSHWGSHEVLIEVLMRTSWGRFVRVALEINTLIFNRKSQFPSFFMFFQSEITIIFIFLQQALVS